MSQLTFERLANHLPAGSVEFIGNNQVKINCSTLTDDSIDLSSSIIESLAKFLRGIALLNDEIDEERLLVGKQRIPFVEQNVSSNGDSSNNYGQMSFTCNFQINTNSFIDNLIDPSDETA